MSVVGSVSHLYGRVIWYQFLQSEASGAAVLECSHTSQPHPAITQVLGKIPFAFCCRHLKNPEVGCWLLSWMVVLHWQHLLSSAEDQWAVHLAQAEMKGSQRPRVPAPLHSCAGAKLGPFAEVKSGFANEVKTNSLYF